MAATFALLVPVKTLTRAKSRLGVSDPHLRQRLVRAFAYDALAAARACSEVATVYVVTDELDLDRPGTVRLPDEGGGDLNEALRNAALRVADLQPGLGIAAMCADVPCLDPLDLATALNEIRAAGRGFVADAAGTGTSLLGVVAGWPLDPLFGPDSAGRHTRSGAIAVTAAVPTMRQDVDTQEDLDAAVALGVGPHTSEVLAGH